MLPLKLYLTVSVVTLLLISLVGGFSGGAVEPQVKVQHSVNGNLISVGSTEVKFVDGKFVCSGLPDRVCSHLRHRFDYSPAELSAAFADVPQRMLKFWGYAMFVLIPVFALMLQLLYRNRGLVYGEHLVFALHLHTFWMLAVLALTVVPGVASAYLGPVIALSVPAYGLLAMRRVYRGRWWPRLARAALMSVLYELVALVVLVVVAAVAVVA